LSVHFCWEPGSENLVSFLILGRDHYGATLVDHVKALPKPREEAVATSFGDGLGFVPLLFESGLCGPAGFDRCIGEGGVLEPKQVGPVKRLPIPSGEFEFLDDI
jgi:hypothetical protein